jgi:phosphoglycerate dehydrogenase-like enzyme
MSEDEEPSTGGNHPFLEMPNVLCMPHLGGAIATPFSSNSEAFEQLAANADGGELASLRRRS